MNLQEMEKNSAQAVVLLKAMANERRLQILCLLHGTELRLERIKLRFVVGVAFTADVVDLVELFFVGPLTCVGHGIILL